MAKARFRSQVLSPKERIFRVLNDIQNRPSGSMDSYPHVERVDIEQEIAREQKLKNDNIEQDIQLKRSTLNRLFGFLSIETTLIFILAFFQATRWPVQFHLDEWSFKIVIAATIGQITAMLYVVVRYLFPESKQ